MRQGQVTVAELLARLVGDEVPMTIFDGLKKRPTHVDSDDQPRQQLSDQEKVPVPAPVKVAPVPIPAPVPVPVAAPLPTPEPVKVEPELSPDDMFGDLKKKKKKKAAIPDFDAPAPPADENAPPSEATPADLAADLDFGEKKKKKKKRPDLAEFEELMKKEGGQALADVTAEAIADDAADEARRAAGGFGAARDMDTEDQVETGEALGEESWLKSDRDYAYAELLSRVFKIIRHNNPDLIGEKKKYTLVPPQVMKEGTKKSIFANVVDIARRMRREPDHLIQYLFAELGTSGSIDGAQRLVMKGRFQQKHIENVLKHYIVEYVTCKTCRSGDTILTKENRLFFLQCQSCGSTKSVSAIKQGFLAQATKRSAMRNAAT